jgi:predicted ester cyclase
VVLHMSVLTWKSSNAKGRRVHLFREFGVNAAPATEQKNLVRRVYEDILGKGQLNLVDSHISDDYVDHSAPPGIPPNKDGFRQWVQTFRTGFPDLSVTVEQIMAEGDRIATRLTLRGTHQGTFMRVAPTNRAITLKGMAFARVSGGKVAERWSIMDLGGLMAQLTQPAAQPAAQAAAGDTDVAKNMDLIVRYFDTIWNKGEFEREPEFVAENVVVHQPPIPGLPEGIAGPLQIVGTFRAAIPDIHVEHTVLFGEGDKVVHRWVAKGHHTAAPLFSAAITDKEITMTGINTFRIANGRIVERWGHMDSLGLVQQLGLAPSN